jgi:hypothetical protein
MMIAGLWNHFVVVVASVMSAMFLTSPSGLYCGLEGECPAGGDLFGFF